MNIHVSAEMNLLKVRATCDNAWILKMRDCQRSGLGKHEKEYTITIFNANDLQVNNSNIQFC